MLAVAISRRADRRVRVFFASTTTIFSPEQIFHITASIEIILGPVIGGVGTLFGPILGAALLTLLSDGITEAVAGWAGRFPASAGFSTAGAAARHHVLPHGIWPPLARDLGLHKR